MPLASVAFVGFFAKKKSALLIKTLIKNSMHVLLFN